jgi:hypothetical protein
MTNERKSLPLRISPELWVELKAWAEQDMRSVNSQIELILRDAVERRKRGANTSMPNQERKRA